MNDDGDDQRGGKKYGELKRAFFLSEDRVIRAVFEEDVSLAESVPNRLLFGQNDHVSDMAFSFALCGDLEEAVEFCIDTLIYAGFFSFDTDYWLSGSNTVEFDEIFDHYDNIAEPQRHLKQWVAEKQAIQSAFADDYTFRPADQKTHLIFCEVERYLCENGQIFRPSWYAARIVREYTSETKECNLFLVGMLWEQLRQKVTNGVELFRRQEQVNRLRDQSAKATGALVQKSENWKAHCEAAAIEILRRDQRKYGNWSEIAGMILSDVEQTPVHSDVRQAYQGNRSKNKPQGTKLVDVSTVARFLSSRFKT